jgi:hypothetical protein
MKISAQAVSSPYWLLAPGFWLLASSYFTVRVTVVVCTAPASDVAAMVITFAPTCASAGAVSRNELLPPTGVEILCGVKIALTPAGKPVTVNPRSALNPPVADVVIGIRTLPLLTSDAAGGAVTANPVTVTVTTTVGDGETPPPVPVTVTE